MELQEHFDLISAEQLRGQIAYDRQLIAGFKNALEPVKDKIAAAEELLALTKDRQADVAEHRMAGAKLLKAQAQAKELEQRIANANHRIDLAQQKISALDKGQARDPIRSAKIRSLFQRLAG